MNNNNTPIAANILIVDDEPNIRQGLKMSLKRDKHNIFTASDGVEAMKILNENEIDVVITDLKMPNMDGTTLMHKINESFFHIPVIVLTGHGDVETAVELMHDGAYDFMEKPFNLEKLSISVANAIKQRQLFIENRDLQSKLAKIGAGSDKVMGKSSKMTKIYDIVQSVAPTKSSVLILGENGVGKEVVSNMIYELSKRNDKPFIKVHCAALSESLLESELFGHEKGAFTGAIKQKKGRFELADGGTLFLDEIGEISQSIQVKLLRVLQEQEFERVGGEETIKVDVRIISATNKNLQELVANGTFREDLYYRLNVVQIDVPPLRERKEDIPLFVTSMLSQISKKNDKVITGISNKAMSCLYNYDWPGNVRELQNVLESAIVMCKSDVIDVPDLPPPLRSAYSENNSVVIEMPATMDAIERVVIAHTLKLANGNKTKAAEMLAMNRKTLHNKIEEYKLE